MRNEIVVLDDVLPLNVYQKLAEFIANETMSYGSRSNSRTDPHGHWSRKFVAAGRHNLADVSYLLEKNEELDALNATWNFLKTSRLKNSILIRCYLNGYTYGTDGYFHSDSDREDEHTAIIFMNDEWEPDWAGETVFLDETGDITRSVLPKRNRGILFPAHLCHAGRGVSRKCVELRQTLIFKTRTRRSDNFERLSIFLRERGAMRLSHRKGSLHDHLVRTFYVLESCGFEDQVCFGGGLHAIYGTSVFTHSLMTRLDKSTIVEEFGEGSEHLAYLFSVLDRPRTLTLPLELNEDTVVVEQRDGRKRELPKKIFEDLRKIECANLLDQSLLGKHKSLSILWNECMLVAKLKSL
jgi:2OG-Fe(II) oxygenase superfamily